MKCSRASSPVEDEDVSKELLRAFKKTGIRVETGAKADPASVQKTDAGVRLNVTLENGKVETVEADWPSGCRRPPSQYRAT